MHLVCGHCGHLNRYNARFCVRCGQSVENAFIQRVPLRSGQYLKGGDYQIQAPLSKGGMGAVYLAKDMHAFGRPCVIKEMLDYYDQSDPKARARAEERFTEEGRTLASLSHPGIPKIYAFFVEDGRHFIVMEYILGEDLEQYVTRPDELGRALSRKLLPEEDLLRYAVQVCGILEYLADQPRPVVHQDIKPANLIRERVVGDVRLVDFGTAWSRRRPAGVLPGGQLSSVYGTMGYAAPEQCQGEPEPRSDVYSLASTLYHLLTDDDPRSHPGHFPKLDNLRPDLRAALEQALRPAPRDRSTARQLREHLEAILTPQRAVGTFAFPGGQRIQSPGALPAMCDKHWEAARGYLYNGDFERWLRDLNRLDLVEVAAAARRRYRDQDAGLEAFLRRLDPGLSRPKLVVEPTRLDVGRVARQGTLPQLLCLRNAGRGYVRANVRTRTSWLQVRPPVVGLLAGQPPAEVSVLVRTQDLPFRGHHLGMVLVSAGAAGQERIPVTAQISLLRELGRNVRRGWDGALPAATLQVRTTAGKLWRVARGAVRVARRAWRPLLIAYVLLGAGTAYGCWRLGRESALERCAVVGLVAPAALLMALWIAAPLFSLAIAALAGALRGIWRTFWK